MCSGYDSVGINTSGGGFRIPESSSRKETSARGCEGSGREDNPGWKEESVPKQKRKGMGLVQEKT